MLLTSHDFQAEILKAIAQETRLSILELLRSGERCVCEIFPAISQEQSNVSRHLNLMQKAGILTRRKDGLRIFYAVKHPEVFAIIDHVASIMTREFGDRHERLRSTHAHLRYTENILDAPVGEPVCWCSTVRKQTILDAIAAGARGLDDVRRMTGACTLGRCKEFNPRGRCCSKEIKLLLEAAINDKEFSS